MRDNFLNYPTVFPHLRVGPADDLTTDVYSAPETEVRTGFIAGPERYPPETVSDHQERLRCVLGIARTSPDLRLARIEMLDELHIPPDVFDPALDEVDFGGEQPAAA
ncbi:hypothetical protein [Micromonospora pisi]|uniref:hypothetical protein n=1 Tax=Micromonospora pisi TaxID=589240 RepID=UPI0011C443A2|nr:hypothetical protein [Micromonospora pisi]